MNFEQHVGVVLERLGHSGWLLPDDDVERAALVFQNGLDDAVEAGGDDRAVSKTGKRADGGLFGGVNGDRVERGSKRELKKARALDAHQELGRLFILVGRQQPFHLGSGAGVGRQSSGLRPLRKVVGSREARADERKHSRAANLSNQVREQGPVVPEFE